MRTTMLMEEAAEGRLSKQALAELLAPSARHTFLEICAVIERDFRARCAEQNGGCLESGCAMEGESCLNALLVAGPEYTQACAAAWRDLFEDPQNRIDEATH